MQEVGELVIQFHIDPQYALPDPPSNRSFSITAFHQILSHFLSFHSFLLFRPPWLWFVLHSLWTGPNVTMVTLDSHHT